MPTASPQVYDAAYAADRAAIEDLMARYLFALDYHDMDAFMAMFTDDIAFEFAPGTVVGKEALLASVTGFKQRIGAIYADEDGNPSTLRHVLAHTAIRIEGNSAWVRAQWFEMADDGPRDPASGRKSPKLGTFGIYSDELRKVGGRWLFAKRRILNEFLDGRHSGPENPVAQMDREAGAGGRGRGSDKLP